MRKWLLLILLVPTFSFADEFSVRDLSGGLYSNPSGNKIPDNSAVELENFFTDVETLAIERNGSEKRDSTVLGGTASVTGIWEFVDNTGQNWIISFSSKTYYRNLIGVAPASFGNKPTVTTVPDCAINLGKIWCVNGTDSMWWFDGASTGVVAGAPLGTLIEPWRNRLIIGNIAGAQSTLRVSADGDGTTWTIGGNATDPFSILVSGSNDGFPVTAMWKSYQDNFVVGRKKDLWYLSGFDQGDWELRNVSSEIGCIQQGSMREFDGSLLFLSARGMEELRGYTITHISEPVRNITDVIVKNTASSRSNTQTSQSDWQAGTVSPTDYLSSTASVGSLVISTSAAHSNLIDTSSGNFNLGSFNGTTSSITIGSLQLASSSVTDLEGCYGADSSFDEDSTGASNETYYRSFISTTGILLGSITMRLGTDNISGGNNVYIVKIYTDNAGAPSTTVLSTVTVNSSWNGILTSPQDITFDTSSDPTFGRVIQISSGTRYWASVNWQHSTSKLRVYYPSPTCNSSEFYKIDSGAIQSTGRYKYKISGAAYPLSGAFVSRTFDMGFTTVSWIWNWSLLYASGTTPSKTSVVYQTQTSSSSSGQWTSAITVSSGSAPTSTVQQYIRYVSTFTTLDRSTSAIVGDIGIVPSEMRRSSGVFTSQVIDTGGSATSWGPTTIADQQQCGIIEYQFNSSTNSSIALFLSTGWATVTSGGVPTNSVQRYYAFRSTFTASCGTATVSLDSFQATWQEGAGAPPIVSWNYDRRYWLAFTTGSASSPYNDRILVYQRNRTWTLLKGINAASFATWRDFLYFGNSSGTGYVYKYDVGNDDDGAVISSRITTKSYDLGTFKNDKDLESLYVNFLGNATAFTGSFSVAYDLNRSGANYSLGSANLSEGTGQVSAKFPFSLSNPVQGREIQYKIVKSGTGDRLKLYELGTIYTLMEAP